jgi:MFS family permease
LYAIIFWLLYRDPSEAKHLSPDEHAYILEGGSQQEHIPTNTVDNLKFLVRQKKIWGLTLGFSAYNYAFNLFLVWLPGYLQTQLHASVLKSGVYLVIPWLVATLTDVLIGGVLVDRLIASGKEPTQVRKVLLTIGMLLGVAAAGATFTTNVNVAVAWLTVSLAGLAFAAPIAWSIPSLIAPKGTVGTVGSIMNFLGNISGIIAPIVAGFVADRFGFGPNFLITGVILIAGIFSFLFLLGRIEQIKTPDSPAINITETSASISTP